MDFNDNMMFTAKEYEILINSVKHLEDEEVEDFIHWAERVRIGDTLVSLVLAGHMEPVYNHEDTDDALKFKLTESGQKLQDDIGDEEANIFAEQLKKCGE